MVSRFDVALAKLVGRNVRGPEFFELAVTVLADITDWRFAAIAQLTDDGDRIQILAAVENNVVLSPWTYELAGTPCCDVYKRPIDEPHWFVGSGLVERFPEDAVLRERGFEAYRGEMFFDDHGCPAGHVFIMHDQPADDEETSRLAFRLVTQRIGAEYNRWHTESEFSVQTERYERATTAGRVGVWKWNLETNEVYFAPILEAMLGCREGEHIRHIDDWVARVDASSGEAMLQEAEDYRDGKISGESIIEYSVTLRGDRQRWFEARAHPILDADGRVFKLVGTDNEITDRKSAEQALQDREDLLNSIFENVPVGLLIKDIHHIVERPNSIYLNWYGLDAETIVGGRSDQVEGFQPSDDATFMNTQEIEVAKTGKTQTRQIERPFADGQVHTISVTKFPIYDQQGSITRVGSVSVDLTEQVRANKALRESEESLRAIFEAAPSGIAVQTVDGEYVRVNQAYRDILGYSEEELRQRTWRDVTHPDDIETTQENDDNVLATNRSSVIEKRYIRKDGRTVWANVAVSVIRDGDGRPQYLVGQLYGITEQKEAQQAMVEARQEAEQANRAKSEFLAAMSHDLRTPLNAILGFAEMISQQLFGEIDKRYQGYADDIQASGAHLLSLVDEILDLSAIEAGKKALTLEELDARAVMSDCENTVSGRAQAGDIDLRLEVPEEPLLFRSDRRAVTQILLNLISNALKFTPPGGRVTVSAADAIGGVVFEIADTGCGIPADDVAKLTEPFVRGQIDPYLTKDGWGLGLSIVRSLVALHDGDFDIESEPGSGTTVKITLPERSATEQNEAGSV